MPALVAAEDSVDSGPTSPQAPSLSKNKIRCPVVELSSPSGAASATSDVGQSPLVARATTKKTSRTVWLCVRALLIKTELSLGEVVSLLRSEFARYGEVIRVNTPFMTTTGPVTVEYSCVDAVQRAVEAWANGPPATGPLANVLLGVDCYRRGRKGKWAKKKLKRARANKI